MNKFSKINLLQIFILAFIIDSCSYPEMVRNELVYENDFESLDLNSIDGGDIMTFNNTNVLGDFNNDGFTLFLEEVGDHDYVFISFDLFIHGSWDGNLNGFSENDKPDKWVMEFKPTLYQIEKGFKRSGNNIIVRFYDELYQPNAVDKDGVPQQKCDESWSMDNIRVRVVKYQ